MKKLILITAVTLLAIVANSQNYCRVLGNATFNTLYTHNPGLVTFDSTGTLQPLNFNGNVNTLLAGNGTFINPSSFSLWQQSGSNIFYTGGNVGIGTNHPNYPLQIVGDVVDSGSLFANNIAAAYSLSVGTIRITNGIVDSIISTTGTLQLHANTVNVPYALNAQIIRTDSIVSATHTVNFVNDTIATTGILRAGTVGINTTTIPSGYSLAVNGAVIATDVYVELYSSWPDYVFDKNYKHKSLEELEAYLNRNHHLPDMPSAKEVKDKGSISVGEITTQNTKQIEELSLDLIELNKTVKTLVEQNKKLEEENKKLTEEINKAK